MTEKINSDSCDYASHFIEQLFTSSFFPLITKATRITDHTETLIDNIFTNNLEKLNDSINGIVFSDISDHLPIVHVFNTNIFGKIRNENEATVIYQRVYSETNISKFKNTIKNLSWKEVLNETNDPEKAFNTFLRLFMDAYDAQFPLKRKHNKSKINNNKSPWMTRCIFKSVRNKNKLYKTFLINPSNRNRQKYIKYKNKLNHVIKIAKKIYYEDQLIKHKQNPKMMWKTLNELLNKPTKNNKLTKTFVESNSSNIIEDPKEIANKFNDYFINVGPNLAKKIKCDDNDTFEKYLNGSYQSSLFLNAITENELEIELENMKSNKSSGYDGINAKILKIIAMEISKPLTHIFNLSFSSGSIPDNLKVALITPIFKSNEDNKFENYRPISVLTCFSKLLEKLVVKRLTQFIDKNNILSKHQYGFRKNRSTEHAIIDFVDKITTAIDQGKFSVGIFLDLSKAFDTINHKILIRKMEHYGIRGIAKKWFENYLCNRKQLVKYNGVESEEMTITSGVPQGSVLGPILFLLYINDIQFCSELVSIILFADDTNILYSETCLKTLNEILQIEMNKIANWLNVNKLSLNTTKTKLILFRSRNKKSKHDLKISINKENIKQVKNITFLGIVIDEFLTWRDHIELISKKIIKCAAIISKIRHFTNLNSLKLIYFALVYPYLTYGNLIWGNAYKSHIQKLVNIQKKIIRLMTFKSYSDHTEPIFNDLKILNVYKLNEYLTSSFMFRYFHLNNLPEIFTNYFITNKDIHNYNTRNASLLHKKYNRTNYNKHTLANKGIDVWNNLPLQYKEIRSFPIFKTTMKKYFLHP